METNIINEGITLLALGIGFVFLFLGLLVLAMNLMSNIINRFSTEEAPTPAIASAPAPIHPDVLTAIRAAITQHREINN